MARGRIQHVCKCFIDMYINQGLIQKLDVEGVKLSISHCC